MNEGKQSRIVTALLTVQLVVVVSLAVFFVVQVQHQNQSLAKNAIAAANATRAQSEANHQVIVTLARDLARHARGSRNRQCASTKMIAYLVRLAPDIKPQILKKVRDFQHQACRLVPITVPEGG